MTRNDDERTPQEWRELLAGFQYPEEANAGRRRERLAARRAHREDARRQTRDWVREQRRRDPIRPAGAVLIVVVILGLGVGARYLWPGLLGGSHDASTRAAATAPPAPGAPAGTPAGAPSSTAAPAPSRSVAVDLGDPDHVAQEAVRLFFTRNPPEDQDHSASVLRAAPYMTPSLVENLTGQDDPSWDKLVSNGGTSTARTTVGPAAAGLPVDTPMRVWRKVTAVVDIQGYTHYTDTTTLQVEMTNADGDGWRVSRMLGL